MRLESDLMQVYVDIISGDDNYEFDDFGGIFSGPTPFLGTGFNLTRI